MCAFMSILDGLLDPFQQHDMNYEVDAIPSMVTTMAKPPYSSPTLQQDPLTSQLYLHSTHPCYLAASSVTLPTSRLGSVFPAGYLYWL